jgi:hypothetical protein
VTEFTTEPLSVKLSLLPDGEGYVCAAVVPHKVHKLSIKLSRIDTADRFAAKRVEGFPPQRAKNGGLRDTIDSQLFKRIWADIVIINPAWRIATRREIPVAGVCCQLSVFSLSC